MLSHLNRICTVCQYSQGTKIFQYCNCPAGQVTNNFHSSCKHMHLSFKSTCNKEHKVVICNMTSWNKFSKSTCPTGQVLWEELLVLSIFHLKLQAEITSGQVEFLSPDSNFETFVLKHSLILFFLVFFRRFDGCSTCGEVVRKRQQRLTCRECGLLCHRTCSGKF